MKLKNSTTWTNRGLRRMVSWVCKNIGYPVRMLRGVTFRNRTTDSCSGHAEYWGTIVISIGPPECFPTKTYRHRDGLQEELADRFEALVELTAHEIAHLDNKRRGVRSRRGGGWGGSERDTDAISYLVLRDFRKEREKLLADWGLEPPAPDLPDDARQTVVMPAPPADLPSSRVATSPPRQSVVERRATRVEALLKQWQRKLKLAQGKVKLYARKARYYTKKLEKS
jgi:hypothetical protein